MHPPASTQATSPVRARALPDLYTIRDEAEVELYLRDRPGTVNDLADIAHVLPEYFPGRGVALDVCYDPEEPLVTLYVGVCARGEAEKAYAQLDLFDSEWWFRSSDDMDPDLCVGLNFS